MWAQFQGETLILMRFVVEHELRYITWLELCPAHDKHTIMVILMVKIIESSSHATNIISLLEIWPYTIVYRRQFLLETFCSGKLLKGVSS